MRLSLQQKEQFFHEMSELLRSGKSFSETLQILAGARSSAVRAVATAMQRGAGDGSAQSFFAAAPKAFPALDREVVAGGEASGRLDEALEFLSGYYASLARARRRIISGSLYPFFILHFAAVMLAIPAFMNSGIEGFLKQALGFLAVFYGLAILVWLAARFAARTAGVNSGADRFLQALPAVGAVRVALVGSRFCLLMGMLVKASGGIFSAMRRSAKASGSALFQRGAEDAVAAVQSGGALGAAVAGTRAFPEAIDRAFQIGETSGRLDEEMMRQAARYTERFNARLDLLSGGVTKLILVAVTLSVAYQILSFYLGYYRSMSQTIDSLFQ